MRYPVLLLVLLLGNFLYAQTPAGETAHFKDTAAIRQALQRTDALLKQTVYDSAGIVTTQIIRHFQANADTANAYFAAALEKYGLSLFYTAQYLEAISYYRRSYDLQSQLNRQPTGDMAYTCYRIGLAFNYSNLEDSSAVWHQKALDIRLKLLPPDDPAIAQSYNGLGMSYDGLEKYAMAIGLYEKARDIWEKAYGRFDVRTANAYNNLGKSYAMIGEDEKSINNKKIALEIRRKVLGPMHADVAASCMNLGYSYATMGQYDVAEEYYAETRKIWSETLPPNHPNLAMVADNTGINYMYQGDYYRALPWLQEALRIRRLNTGDNSFETGKSWLNLGFYYTRKGQYDKGIQYFKEAANIFEQLPGADYARFLTYSNLGVCYSDLEQYEAGLATAEDALKIGISLLGEPNSLLIDSYYNIGISWQGLGNWEKALLWKQKAHDEGLAQLGESHPDYIQYVEGLAYYYRDKGEPEKAMPLFEKALALHAKLSGENAPKCGKMKGEIGNALLALNRLAAAKPYFEEAKTLLGMGKPVEQLPDLQALIQVLRDDALLHQKLFNTSGDPKDFAAARADLEAARLLFGRKRATLEGQNAFRFWQNLMQPVQENAIGLLVSGNCADCNATAFAIAEDAKAFQLYAAFKKSEALHLANIPDSLLLLEMDLRRMIAEKEKAAVDATNNQQVNADSMVNALNRQLFALRRDYESLQLRFEKVWPEYYRLKYNLSTITLAEVQHTLLAPNQALLEYFVGDSSISLMVVRPDTTILLAIKRDFPLDNWIEQLRQGLFGYYTADASVRNDALFESMVEQYLQYAHQLYNKLVAPVQQWLPEQVIIVPDGPLGYLPFDALLTSVPKNVNDFKAFPYLLQRHQISYTYSATLLQEMRDKKHRREPSTTFVAFAPFYSGDSLILSGQELASRTRTGFDPLPYTKLEVDRLHQIMGGDLVSGNYATKPRFLETAANYRILHLATHGVADNRVGDYAFLVFAETKDSTDNELLYVKDLYNLELNADLVVLSACETGAGKLERGEGIISLARAFAYAGAKSMITSLWSVSDKSTSELMTGFYQELKAGKTKDQALRQARQAYLKKAVVGNCHPFFWAAFVPVGDMRAVKK